jgi:hypothetical protein
MAGVIDKKTGCSQTFKNQAGLIHHCKSYSPFREVIHKASKFIDKSVLNIYTARIGNGQKA